jgi:Ser/Thr protein kinase RdoA (MazF antagonist)
MPARPIYAPAPPDLAAAIASALGVAAPVFALKNAGGSSPTFRVDAAEPLFVKLVSADRWRELREAELIARWLAAQGAPAIAARNVDPPELPGGEFVVAYPFAEGRPPSASLDDARALGEGVARVHAALLRHPDGPRWQATTARRLDRLVAVRAALAGGELIAGPRPKELRVLASDHAISFLPGVPGTPARPLHGDLNIFNIVIQRGSARFIDFEDVVHSVLPPESDVALVCERVILVQESRDANAAAAIDALLDAYAGAGGATINRAVLADVLRGLSLRSLCTLALSDPSGHDAVEWNKFFSLIDAADRRRTVFA